MKKWYAECLDNNNEIINLTTRATSKWQAMTNLQTQYRLNAIFQVDDKPLFKSPMVSYMSSSLAALV